MLQELGVVEVPVAHTVLLLQEAGTLLITQMFPATPVMLVLQGLVALEAQVARQVVTLLPSTPLLTWTYTEVTAVLGVVLEVGAVLVTPGVQGLQVTQVLRALGRQMVTPVLQVLRVTQVLRALGQLAVTPVLQALRVIQVL